MMGMCGLPGLARRARCCERRRQS